MFEDASPQYIPSILSTMTKSSVRSADDIVVGTPLEYKSGPNAAWRMGILSIMGVDLANTSIPLLWQSNAAFNLRPTFLVYDRINAYVQPSDTPGRAAAAEHTRTRKRTCMCHCGGAAAAL
jgi:hypothetical protein